jgi:uncharacterized protein (DUF488 family)
MSDTVPTVLTVGHSTHSIEWFLQLMRDAHVEVVVDVRSQPYSRYSPQFNLRDLEAALKRTGLRYVSMGDELGGRPVGDQFYDEDGYVRYDRLAQSPAFLAGIERLNEGARRYRVAIMCSEEDPMDCHRRLLVGRVLDGLGVESVHLRGDGTLEDDSSVARRELLEHPGRYSLSMFGSKEEEWRSTRSVSEGTARPSSSEL